MLEKILGGLVGLAMGDAWAMPALLTPGDTRKHFKGWIDDFYAAPDEHPVHHGLPAGRVTDDTEQAFALAEAIITEGGVSMEGTAQALLQWYQRVDGDTCAYIGPSTQRAIVAILAGEDISKTGRFGDTNGAAMRVAPVGFIHPGDIEGAVHDAYLTCIPTHNTDVAVSGASAIAGAIATAMQPGVSLDEIIAAGMKAADLGRAFGERWIGASISRRIDQAVEIARSNSSSEYSRLQEIYDLIGASLSITESVPAAFGVLAMGRGDPKQTAIYAAGLSGDADTIGAMACAIAGTWKGITVIPYQYFLKLRKKNPELDFDKTAEGLFQVIQRRNQEK
ncbi:MAG: ADP-ribosylglycohydrolase family protein [Chloroflexota bacterium]